MREDPARQVGDRDVDARGAEIGDEQMPSVGAEADGARGTAAGRRADSALGDEPVVGERCEPLPDQGAAEAGRLDELGAGAGAAAAHVVEHLDQARRALGCATGTGLATRSAYCRNG